MCYLGWGWWEESYPASVCLFLPVSADGVLPSYTHLKSPVLAGTQADTCQNGHLPTSLSRLL